MLNKGGNDCTNGYNLCSIEPFANLLQTGTRLEKNTPITVAIVEDNRGTREWLLRFEFGRDGTTVHAVGPRS